MDGDGAVHRHDLRLFVAHDADEHLHQPVAHAVSEPEVAATQFTIYNSLSNLPVSLGATLFAIIGGTGEMVRVLLIMAGLCVLGALIYATMTIGNRPVAADPVPEIN